MYKQQVSSTSVIIDQLTLDLWIINTLGGQGRKRSGSRAELFSRPPREYFHLSPLTEIT